MAFEPGAAFGEQIAHEGVDIMLVTEGELLVRINESDDRVASGQCAIWSASYRHALRNASDKPARALGVVTEAVY